jgi:hypothetical protein
VPMNSATKARPKPFAASVILDNLQALPCSRP